MLWPRSGRTHLSLPAHVLAYHKHALTSCSSFLLSLGTGTLHIFDRYWFTTLNTVVSAQVKEAVPRSHVCCKGTLAFFDHYLAIAASLSHSLESLACIWRHAGYITFFPEVVSCRCTPTSLSFLVMSLSLSVVPSLHPTYLSQLLTISPQCWLSWCLLSEHEINFRCAVRLGHQDAFSRISTRVVFVCPFKHCYAQPAAARMMTLTNSGNPSLDNSFLCTTLYNVLTFFPLIVLTWAQESPKTAHHAPY